MMDMLITLTAVNAVFFNVYVYQSIILYMLTLYSFDNYTSIGGGKSIITNNNFKFS